MRTVFIPGTDSVSRAVNWIASQVAGLNARKNPFFFNSTETLSSAQTFVPGASYTDFHSLAVERGNEKALLVIGSGLFTVTGTAVYMLQLTRGDKEICGGVSFRGNGSGVSEHNERFLIGVDSNLPDTEIVTYKMRMLISSGTGNPDYTMRSLVAVRGWI